MTDQETNEEVLETKEEPVETEKQTEAKPEESTIDNLDDALKEISKLRREAATKRVKNKELEESASKWQHHLDEQKTELERVVERANKADVLNTKLQHDMLVEKLVNKFDINEDFRELLIGETEEDLTTKAEKISKLQKSKEGENKKPDFFAGQRGKAVVPSEDLNSFFNKMWKDVDSTSTKTTF